MAWIEKTEVSQTVTSSSASVTVANCPASFNSQFTSTADPWVQDTPNSSGVWALGTFAGPTPPAGGYFKTAGLQLRT